MRSFVAISLTLAEIDAAYPLIQALWPGQNLEGWRSFAARWLDAADSGILGLRSEAGYLTGIALWRLAPDLEHGPVLIVDYLVALDLLEPGQVAAALADGLENIARHKGAQALHVTLPRTEPLLLQPFLASGHHFEGVKLCKTVAPAP